MSVSLLSTYKLFSFFRDTIRYDYTHEILPGEQSIFKGESIQKDRRISIILRNEPDQKETS